MKAMASQPQMVRGLATQIENVVSALEIAQTGESPSKQKNQVEDGLCKEDD